MGASDKRELLGRRADEVFPAPLGVAFRAQDEEVLSRGRAIEHRLELHLYPRGGRGWCRTYKIPVFDAGEVHGLLGFSKDLHRPASDQTPAGLSKALAFLEGHLDRRLKVEDLAAAAGMATRSFERRIQELFRISAGDLIIQARVDLACRLLRETDLPISHIAQDCGYAEHSSFSRQFRSRVGLTPRAFRGLQAWRSRTSLSRLPS